VAVRVGEAVTVPEGEADRLATAVEREVPVDPDGEPSVAVDCPVAADAGLASVAADSVSGSATAVSSVDSSSGSVAVSSVAPSSASDSSSIWYRSS